MTDVGCRYKICCQKLISSFRVKIVLSGEQCTRSRTLSRAQLLARAPAHVLRALARLAPRTCTPLHPSTFPSIQPSHPTLEHFQDSFLVSRGKVRMDRLHPCLRLDVIVTQAADIMRLWRTLCPIDRAFLRLIVGDLPLLADSPIDWTLLRTTISFWDTQRAVFSFQGTELVPTVEEYAALIQRPMLTHDIVVPNQFAMIQSRLAVLLDLHDEEIRHELRYG
ncbi:hypothetical protein CRG98_016101 [Punica granatum]|uniref:DUF7745 domain-containing protein n=1 Tax=Punica granatum TaxID=22663 RepID=A0A2I0K4F4_PUNGR|nr:hypothetical protein CRG98_016101 [Punica granatum]